MTDVLREIVLPRLDGVRKSGSGFMARCPAHDDGTASLSVGPGRDQPVVLNCQAGCRPDDVLGKLGLTWEDLSNPRERKAKPTVVAEYEYRDENGQLLYVVERRLPKDFRCKRPDGAGGWVYQGAMTGVRRVLYRLPELHAAVRDGQPVYVVEGEKDADTLHAAGKVATCNVHGAGKWRDEYARPFTGATVRIIADRDDPGRAHAATVAASMRGVTASVSVAQPPEGCKDISDLLAAGRKLTELELLDGPPAETPPVGAHHLQELVAYLGQADEPYDWLIPGLFERQDRLIVTGGEGDGKSTLLRQIGVQAASGVHPFGGPDFDPLRVVIIDLENSDRQLRRELRPLHLAAGDRYAGNLYAVSRLDGLNLLDPNDVAWFLAELENHPPDLLITGPAYKLIAGDPTEEGPARTVSGHLDRARATYGCVVLLEAHQPHGANGQRRPLRPYGASLWLRWPEFGLCLTKDGHLRHWRGARDTRDWPAALQRGGQWPWTVVTRPRDVLWAQIVAYCEEGNPDRIPGQREIAQALDVSPMTINRTISEHPDEWARMQGQQALDLRNSEGNRDVTT
jgi:AAA domain